MRRILAGESVEAVLGKDASRKAREELAKNVAQIREQAAAQAPPQRADLSAGNAAGTAPGGAGADPTDPVDGLLDYLFGGAE